MIVITTNFKSFETALAIRQSLQSFRGVFLHSKWLHSLLIHFKFEKNAGSFIVISPGGSCPGSLAREQFIASVDSESMAPHKRAQIRPRLRTAVRARPHPSGRGRSDGYAHEFRLPAVCVEFNGLARNHEIRQMRLMHRGKNEQ